MEQIWNQLADVLIRSVLAVLVGLIIGNERARHGREAGMRTHILVALGAAMTSMISIYAGQILGNQGDLLRLSAQVISGVGFLGAGVIVFKNNNIITGLTTAAGVWTTSIIGIAGVLSDLRKHEHYESPSVRRRKKSESAYIEIDDMYMANDIIDDIRKQSGVLLAYRMQPPKSGTVGHLGVNLFFENHDNFSVNDLRRHEHIVFVEEE